MNEVVKLSGTLKCLRKNEIDKKEERRRRECSWALAKALKS